MQICRSFTKDLKVILQKNSAEQISRKMHEKTRKTSNSGPIHEIYHAENSSLKY